MTTRQWERTDAVEREDRGSTLLEVLMSLVFIASGTFLVIGAIVGSSATDEAVREDAQALRACLSAMNEVVAFDYEGDIQNLIDYWQGPQAQFEVPSLRAADGGLSQGTVTLDATDPERVRVLVRVDWVSRTGARSLELPMVITETER